MSAASIALSVGAVVLYGIGAGLTVYVMHVRWEMRHERYNLTKRTYEHVVHPLTVLLTVLCPVGLPAVLMVDFLSWRGRRGEDESEGLPEQVEVVGVETPSSGTQLDR